MPEAIKPDPNKGGRIVLDKDGNVLSVHHIDPHQKHNLDKAAIAAAHSYDGSEGQKFNKLTPDELKARRVEPATTSETAEAGAPVAGKKEGTK